MGVYTPAWHWETQLEGGDGDSESNSACRKDVRLHEGETEARPLWPGRMGAGGRWCQRGSDVCDGREGLELGQMLWAVIKEFKEGFWGTYTLRRPLCLLGVDHEEFIIKQSLRAASAVKDPYCSCGGPGFGFFSHESSNRQKPHVQAKHS